MSAATPTPLVAACDWSIVVLARAEAAALARCLEAIRAAAAGRDAQVTVLLTGSAEASVAVAERFAADAFAPGGAPRLRVFHIPHADRANAWNQYVHALRPEAAMHVFVEAHAAMSPGALRSLAEALAEHPAAMAATGLPGSGPQAAAVRAGLRSGGRLHGALHALRGEFLDGIARAGLRLPVGLGEIHPVIAGLLGDRIVVAEEASWRGTPLGWFSPKGVARAWRRKLRQARAGFEVQALAEAGALPETAAPLLRDWLAARPRPPGFFPWLASRRLAGEVTPAYGDLLPRRIALADVAISPRASGPRPAPAA